MSDDNNDTLNILDEFDELKKEYDKILRRFGSTRPLTTREKKLKEYKTSLQNAYNDIVNFNKKYLELLQPTEKTKVEKKLDKIIDKLNQSFEILGINQEVPGDYYTKIEISLNTDDTENDDINEQIEIVENNTTTIKPKNNKMNKMEFLSFAAQQIKYKFSGNPLELESFLNSIELVKEVMDANEQTFIKFILTRIDGKALESVSKNPTTIQEIIENLKKYIKPENSKIIEGRMLTLRANRSNMPEYTKTAEELAEALQRSLIIEGISQQKAREMTIDRTIEMCRANAKTDIVKSIMASTKFEDPKETIAKFVIESNNNEKTSQILTFGVNNYRGKRGMNQNRGFYRGFQRNNNYRGNYNNNRGNYNNFRRYNNRNNYNNNNRGRNSQNYNNSNNNNRGRNNQNVRVLHSENQENPRSMTLGDANWRTNQ